MEAILLHPPPQFPLFYNLVTLAYMCAELVIQVHSTVVILRGSLLLCRDEAKVSHETLLSSFSLVLMNWKIL